MTFAALLHRRRNTRRLEYLAVLDAFPTTTRDDAMAIAFQRMCEADRHLAWVLFERPGAPGDVATSLADEQVAFRKLAAVLRRVWMLPVKRPDE